MLAVGLLLAGCRSTGAYPFDYFSEMHYQESYRAGEPQRMQPPERSVPISGAEEPLTAASIATLQNPLRPTPDNLARAADLFRVNCQPCHGAQGKGDGIVSTYFKNASQTHPDVRQPADYTSATVRARSDGELYHTVTNGLNPTSVGAGMPPFGGLLTPQERWLLVLQIRALQGQ